MVHISRTTSSDPRFSGSSCVGYVFLFCFSCPPQHEPHTGLAADRYAHIPCTVVLAPVLSTLIAKLFTAFSRPNTKRALFGVLMGVLLMSSFESTSYSKVWSTSISLWTHTVHVQPRNAFALNNLASTMWQEGDMGPETYDRVLKLYRESLSYDSSSIDTLCNVATLLGVPYVIAVWCVFSVVL